MDFSRFDPKWTLFEDDTIVVVNKPPGLPSQPTRDPNRPNLYTLMTQAFPYVALMHRLDRDTTGLMIFSKDKKANTALGDAFKERRVEKTYLALVSTNPERRTVGETWIRKSYLKPVHRLASSKTLEVTSGGDYAESSFVLVSWDEKNGRGRGVVEINPKTGRMHQVRVHLAAEGMPILGDSVYGAETKPNPVKRVMLHAWKLALPHPVSKVIVRFEAPVPGDFLKLAHLSE